MGLAGQDVPAGNAQRGYAMVALLVSIAIMSVLMSVAMPVWRQQVQREREAELVFRGEQYARAIGLYQRKFPGAFPPNLDVLVQQRFLRKKYKDPMTESGEFQLLYAGAQPGSPQGGGNVSGAGRLGAQGGGQMSSRASAGQTQAAGQIAGGRAGIIGVVSKSQGASVKLYKGRGRYSEWQFIYSAVSTQPGGIGQPGGQRPGMGAPGMRPGMPPGLGPGGSMPTRPGGMPFPPGSDRQGPGGQRPPGAPQPGRPPGVPRS